MTVVHLLKERKDRHIKAKCGYFVEMKRNGRQDPEFTAWGSKVTCTACR